MCVTVDKTEDAHRFAKKMGKKPSVLAEMATNCLKMEKLAKRVSVLTQNSIEIDCWIKYQFSRVEILEIL